MVAKGVPPLPGLPPEPSEAYREFWQKQREIDDLLEATNPQASSSSPRRTKADIIASALKDLPQGLTAKQIERELEKRGITNVTRTTLWRARAQNNKR